MIIRLLHDMLGVAFDKECEPSQMPGFLFDMNSFFQRLLCKRRTGALAVAA
jgi:hypothetical protein